MTKESMQELVLEAIAPDLAGCALRTAPVPEPVRGEVLVRVRACSLGFPDLLMTRGEYQAKPPMPFVLGSDVAGDVVAVGADVHGVAVGQAVVATRLGGGLAEYAVYSAQDLRPKPPGMSYAEAASFGAAYLTAYVALVRRAQIRHGEWLLVHGCAGGVGLAAVDLGRALGARVIAASASADKLAVVQREYQPDAVLLTAEPFKDEVKRITAGAGADVIYDPVGGDAFDESLRCIAFGGRLLVVGFASGRIPAVPANLPLIKGFSVVGVRAGEYGRRYPELGRENMAAIWDFAAQGLVRPRVHAALPLDEWRDAFAAMAGRQLVGRVVLCPQGPLAAQEKS